ncbi:hypothetical protein [Roseibium sp.]|uniref:hypothetical protein n=1 Tax=Roseibium sp. TaxID=1936156 RepID=UPI003D10FF0F
MSIQLELRVTPGVPVYRGHDHYWSVMRDLGKNGAEFTLAEIASRSNDPRDKSIGDFLQRLIKAEIVAVSRSYNEPTARGGSVKHNVYRLMSRPTKTPVVNRDGSVGQQGEKNANMWTAMRCLSQFTKHDLAISAATDELPVSVNSAATYIQHLFKAGYLLVMRPNKSRVPAVWRLKPSMNTGPEAPKILKTKLVYDVNKGRVMGAPLAEECAA